MRNKETKKQLNISGITLIALVITIIVLLIIAGISINALFGENGLLKKSEEAKFKAKMSAIAEEWKLYVADCLAEYPPTVDINELFAGGTILYDIIADEEIEMDLGSIRDIRKITKEMEDEQEKYSMAFEGEFYYVSQKTIPNNQKQVQWCQEIGIKIWEYTGRSDSKVVNGDYKNIKRSVFMYAKTRYRICKRKN